jgi:hypothetical protein
LIKIVRLQFKEELTCSARFRVIDRRREILARAVLGSSSNGFRWLPDDGDGRTRYRRTLGLDGGDGALDRFQKRERKMAGAAMGGGVLQPLVEHVDPLQIRRGRGVKVELRVEGGR